MLQNAGPVRTDGTDKFFGLENVRRVQPSDPPLAVPPPSNGPLGTWLIIVLTVWKHMVRRERRPPVRVSPPETAPGTDTSIACSYCNSIVQALFYSEAFRNHVVNYPAPAEGPNGVRPKVNVTLRPPMTNAPPTAEQKQAEAAKRRQLGAPPLANPHAVRPEDKPDSPEYKKKQVMMKGPILELANANSKAYGMDECTFTGLKDIFLALIESQTRTGVLSPQRFLEIFKRDNEMFRNSMHQDAHEFYGLVLNDVISNVEANAMRARDLEVAQMKREASLSQSVEKAVGASSAVLSSMMPATGWVHDIFEGVLTSETKCLTCETASQRDETFLDLSIDLEEHSSVTSCLGKFSAEEMLCERNKFHCDHCGGLQEAEKRMKIHKLPKVLAFHLKRFKYTEDYSRLQKLFHRVVYPYHLRLFNTTDDADDPDRLYELYAVVVHIGGNAYHGHYVSVIKTKDRGWVLFDDEMVEPVDKHFVRNFFGDKPGMACAYVLFYQETTFEKMRAEQEAEGFDDLIASNDKAASSVSVGDGAPDGAPNGVPLTKAASHTTSPRESSDAAAKPAPMPIPGSVSSVMEQVRTPPRPVPMAASAPASAPEKTKEERKREKKEAEAAEKARKAAAKLGEKQRKEREKLRNGQGADDDAALRRAIEASKADLKNGSGNGNEEEGDKAEKAEKAWGSPRNSSGFLSKSVSKRSLGFLNKTISTESAPAAAPGSGSGSGPAANGDASGQAGGDRNERFRRQFSFGLGKKKSGANLLSTSTS